MPTTFEKIATTTLSSPASSITFSSISQAYTDLQIHLRCKMASSSTHLYVRMGNGSVDTGAIYGNQSLFARGAPSAAASGEWISALENNYKFPLTSFVGDTSNSFSPLMFYVFNYSATNTKKAIQTMSNTVLNTSSQYAGIEYCNGMVNTSVAINIIEFRHLSGSNIDTGTSITIYGIKKA